MNHNPNTNFDLNLNHRIYLHTNQDQNTIFGSTLNLNPELNLNYLLRSNPNLDPNTNLQSALHEMRIK